jgi:dihydrofolate reductase
MSKVKVILACDKSGLIGDGLKIPWHFPEDFKHFKETTDGHIIVMGRKTWDSLPRKPLPNRENIIITRTMHLDPYAMAYNNTNAFVSLQECHDWWKETNDTRDLFIIGGSQIYNAAFNELQIDEVYLTLIKGNYTGDTYFNMENLKDEVWDIKTLKDTPDFEIQHWRHYGS